MGRKKIDELTSLPSLSVDDYVPVARASDGKTFKFTIAQILALGFARRGFLENVTTAGASVAFGSPFSTLSLTKGDYHLTVKAYDSLVEEDKVELGCRTVESPTGFNVFPAATAAYITWEASAIIDEQTGVNTAEDSQSGAVISSDASAEPIVFENAYDTADSYNVAYARGFLTDTPTSAVAIAVTKSATGLTLTPAASAAGLSVTIEWGVERKTQ